MSVVVLTDKIVARIDRGTELRDLAVIGLSLRCQIRKKSWNFHARVEGKLRRIGLGSFPAISTQEARARALDIRRSLEAPAPFVSNPKKGQSSSVSECVVAPTFSQCLLRYVESKRTLSSNTKGSYKRALLHLAPINDKPIDHITPEDIRTVYASLSKTLSPATANLTLRIVKAVHRHWHTMQEKVYPNVFGKLKALGEVKASNVRSRVLDSAEISALGKSDLGQQERLLLDVGLLTGLRLSELKQLTPTLIDRTAMTLTIPLTKNGKEHVLPVSTALLDLLDSAPLMRGRAFYFGGRTDHLALSIGKKTGIKFSAHDLRRTFATTAARLKVEDSIIKKLLNHTAQDVTGRHYLHLTPDDLKPAMNKIQEYMLRLLQGA